MKHRPNSFQLRYFHCPVCHTKMTAPKNLHRIKGKESRKWMYCYQCKTDQNFIMDNAEPLRC